MDLIECARCHKDVPQEETEAVEVYLSRQTFWEPAESETQTWCSTCRRRAEYEDQREKGDDD